MDDHLEDATDSKRFYLRTEKMFLSICIPTHDGRDWCLKEAIDSVLPQIVGRHEGDVEICVSDNGSADRTQELLADYVARFPHIFRIHRFEQNMGGHHNFLKVVEMATGEYCWLLGSDDHVAPGAIDSILTNLRLSPTVSIITFRWQTFFPDRETRFDDLPFLGPSYPTRNTLLNDIETIARELFLRFTFMSGHAFKRNLWQEVVLLDDVIQYRHFMHLYIFCRIVARNPQAAYTGAILVYRRGENESLYHELNHDRIRHFKETIDDVHRSWTSTIPAYSSAHRDLSYRLYRLQWIGFKAWKLYQEMSYRDALIVAHEWGRRVWFTWHFWVIGLPTMLLPTGTYRMVRQGIGLRTRFRGFLRLIRIENAWTRNYDIARSQILKLDALKRQNPHGQNPWRSNLEKE